MIMPRCSPNNVRFNALLLFWSFPLFCPPAVIFDASPVQRSQFAACTNNNKPAVLITTYHTQVLYLPASTVHRRLYRRYHIPNPPPPPPSLISHTSQCFIIPPICPTRPTSNCAGLASTFLLPSSALLPCPALPYLLLLLLLPNLTYPCSLVRCCLLDSCNWTWPRIV